MANKIKSISIYVILFLFLSCLPAEAKKSYGNLNVSRINSVYDGDTFRCDIDSVSSLIGDNISIRIANIDTPEIRGGSKREKDLALKARSVTLDMLEAAYHIELRNIQRPKYFRILADVYVDGVSIGDVLIEKGLAKPYFGGKKGKW